LQLKLGTSVLHLALPLTVVALGALPGGDLARNGAPGAFWSR